MIKIHLIWQRTNGKVAQKANQSRFLSRDVCLPNHNDLYDGPAAIPRRIITIAASVVAVSASSANGHMRFGWASQALREDLNPY